MTDFMKINFKFLIPTEEKKRDLFLKMKPGETVTAKVADKSSDGKVLLNIKGTEVMAETSRNLKKGDVISVSVQTLDKERVFVKIEEKINKTQNSEIQENNNYKKISEKLNELKNNIKSEALKGGIYINGEKIDNVIEKYFNIKSIEIKGKKFEETQKNIKTTDSEDSAKNSSKLTDNMGASENIKTNSEQALFSVNRAYRSSEKNIVKNMSENILPEVLEKGLRDAGSEKNTLKTLMVMEKFDIPYNDDSFKYIKSYFSKENAKNISTDEEAAKNIKEMVAGLKDGKEDIDKGTNLINSFNRIEEKNQLEFVLTLNNSALAEVKINYEADKKNERKIDRENFSLNLKLTLENLGDIEIKTAVWNKHMGITFGMDNREKVKNIMENSHELNSRLTHMGYVVDEIKGRIEEKKEEIKIKGVNVEA